MEGIISNIRVTMYLVKSANGCTISSGLFDNVCAMTEQDAFILVDGSTCREHGYNDVCGPCIERTLVVCDDNSLTLQGVLNLCTTFKQVIVCTANQQHPAMFLHRDNLSVHAILPWSVSLLVERLSLLNVCRTLYLLGEGTVQRECLAAGIVHEVFVEQRPTLSLESTSVQLVKVASTSVGTAAVGLRYQFGDGVT